MQSGWKFRYIEYGDTELSSVGLGLNKTGEPTATKALDLSTELQENSEITANKFCIRQADFFLFLYSYRNIMLSLSAAFPLSITLS